MDEPMKLPTVDKPLHSPTMLTQRSLLTVFLVAGLLMSTVIGVLLYLSFHLSNVQRQTDRDRVTTAKNTSAQLLFNRETGYSTRSVSCAILAVQVGKAALPPSCLERPVLAYYNPDEIPRAASATRQAYNTRLLCEILHRDASCLSVTP